MSHTAKHEPCSYQQVIKIMLRCYELRQSILQSLHHRPLLGLILQIPIQPLK